MFCEDDCGQNTVCTDKKYKYMFCKQNDWSSESTLYRICADDPFSLEPEYIPLTPPMPICVSFDMNSLKCDEYKMGKPTGGNQYLVFKKSLVVQECNNAVYDWLCLCGLENEPCKCEVKVMFSDEEILFPANSDIIARSRIYWFNSENECELSCQYTYIAFNNTKEFTGTDPDNCLKEKFFINDYFFQEDETYTVYLTQEGLIVYNFIQWLQHELGHIFGLDHHMFEDDSPTCDEFSWGLMNASFSSLGGTRTYLSSDDICQFKKLHCPDLVGVNEYYTNKDKKSKPFPNPSEDITNISFSLSSYSETTILYVYNCLGNTVKILDLKNLDFSNEVHIIQIPTNDLAPGQYFYKIVNETTVETGKFIIVR